MLSPTRLTIYLLFLVSLAIWVGGGVFDTISSHPAWHANPAAYIRAYELPAGTVNPWPFTTALMALTTLAGLAAFARYHGAGRRPILTVLIGLLLMLLATGFYFVPTLIKLAHHQTLTDEQITSMSLTWIYLNIGRILLLLGLFYYGLLALWRLGRASADPATIR